MATLGIGPVPRTNPGSGRYYSGKPRRRSAEPQKVPVATPSYEVEAGAPIGAKKWLKSLFQASAIHLSADRIATLLDRRREDETQGKDEQQGKDEAVPAKVYCGPTCTVYREAVELEERDAVLHLERSPARHRATYLVLFLVLGAAGIFLLTVAVLDTVFGTRSLNALLTMFLR